MRTRKTCCLKLVLVVCLLLGFNGSISAYSNLKAVNYPKNLYWGDTHVHTNLSEDAFLWGNQVLGPEFAYRFAQGQEIALHGKTIKMERPLDFLVVADHASAIGLFDELLNKKSPAMLATRLGKKWQGLIGEANDAKGLSTAIKAVSTEMWQEDISALDPIRNTVWRQSMGIADAYNNPGHFTAFIGYEWSPAFNLHRVVIFKGDSNSVGHFVPFTARDSFDPEDLWRYMLDYEDKTDGEVLAIPHNSNLARGAMFALETAKGQVLSNSYANTRSRWEPLLEVTQMKGDSETHPLLSPSDDFADFERIESVDISPYLGFLRNKGYQDYISWHDRRQAVEADDNWMRPYEYARSGLKLGLVEQARLGINPFKFGMIGSTDTHTSLSTAEESSFLGKLSNGFPEHRRMFDAWDGKPINSDLGKWWGAGWRQSASGYAAIWAEENTRESLFAAMKRKEVYASTGPRITVRFFGGWDYQDTDAFKPDLASIGYRQGVPMGGDLTAAPANISPRFLIRAVKDPDGANLDRVQVIKGWHDANGELHEKIYNVALSDDRTDQGVYTKRVGNTVDVPDASYTNTIGDPELAVVWQDPDFDPNELAFYYLRVLEIPTPRWTAYDAKYFQLKDIPDEVPMITQERAYSSPIWYTP